MAAVTHLDDELAHADKVRREMVPQVEAARVMLAALRDLLDGREASPAEYARRARTAIAQAEAAGIK